MTERFTAPLDGRFGTEASPLFTGLPQGSSTEVEFDTTTWQAVPPRIFTRLVGAPDFELYHEMDEPVAFMARRTAAGYVSVEARRTSDSGGYVSQGERTEGTEADSTIYATVAWTEMPDPPGEA